MRSPSRQPGPERQVVVGLSTEQPAEAGAPGAPASPPGPGQAASPATPTEPNSGGTRWWLWVTRGLIVVVLAGVAYLLLAEKPERCGDQLTDDGQKVEVCTPIEATSPEALLVVLVIGLLLLPELTELEVGGVVTLRRAVAEAKGQATQARAEAAEARLASSQLAARVEARLTANPSATANPTVYNIFQAQQTAEAQQELAGADDARGPAGAPVAPSLGESSLVAFTAGLVGLAAQLPPVDEKVQVSVVGLTLANNRQELEATHNPFDVPDGIVARAEQLLNEADMRPGDVVTAVELSALLVVTLALVGGEQVVGGLAAVLRPAPSLADATGDDPLDELGAAVRIAAGGYAQLLADLLGEQPVEGW